MRGTPAFVIGNQFVPGAVDADTLKPFEIGGTSDAQLAYLDEIRESLNRLSGLSEALRGETTGAPTAPQGRACWRWRRTSCARRSTASSASPTC